MKELGSIISQVIAGILVEAITSHSLMCVILLLLIILRIILYYHEKKKHYEDTVERYKEYLANDNSRTAELLRSSSSRPIKKLKNLKSGIYLLGYEIFSALDQEIIEFTLNFNKQTINHFGLILIFRNDNKERKKVKIEIRIDHKKILKSRQPHPIVLSPQNIFTPKLFICENDFEQLNKGKHKIELWANHKKVINDYFYIEENEILVSNNK